VENALEAEREAVASELMPLWKKWIDVAIGWHGCASGLLLIATAPACRGIWRELLVALGASRLRKWVRNSEEPLVSFLEKVWTEHGSELDPSVRNSFDALLYALLEGQVPRAIALSRLVALGQTS
jgi:hypothetical protein